MPETKNIENRHSGPGPVSVRHDEPGPDSRWFAARVIGSDALVTKRLDHDGIHCYRTKFTPGIVFMRCTATYASELLFLYWGRIYFYLDAERKHPAPIPEKEMNNFILVTSVTGDLITLTDITETFLKGDRVRVTAGLFEGAEGVIKRIKGHRRLVVSINCFVAVATCFIRPEFLEKINE